MTKLSLEKSRIVRGLMGGASVLAIGVMMAPALAQETMETVVVTGIRASLQSAQSIKQNSSQVVDSITAVDIGALPDRNIAEALQRVPGVTLQRNDSPNDLVRMGSTGNSVFIRGMSWVKSLVNGRDEFTAKNGRSLSFGDVSADLMQAVNVYKSPTAAQIEGGVGGTVDLITRKPFDQDGFKLALSGDYTYGDLLHAGRPSGNALVSDRWNTGIGEVGILASVDWQDVVNRTEGINIDQYSCYNQVPYTGADGSTQAVGGHQAATDASYARCTALGFGPNGFLFAPKGWAWRQMEFQEQRLASNVVLQWRPSDKLELTLFAMNTYAHNQDMEHYDYNQNNANHFDSNNNFTRMDSTLTSIDTRGGSGHNRDTDISLNIKFTPTDRLEVSADMQFVESSSPYRNMTFFTGFQNTLHTGLDVSGVEPIISYDHSVNTTDPANFNWLAAMDHLDNNVAHAYNGRIDATYKFEGNGAFGLFKSIDIGFRTEQKVAVSHGTGYNWAFLEANWLAGGNYVTLDGQLHCNTAPCSYKSVDGTTYTSVTGGLADAVHSAELFNYHSVIGNAVPALWVPKATLARMNTLASYKIMKSIEPGPGNLTGWAAGDQVWSQWIPYSAEHGCSGDDITCAAAYNKTPGSASAGNSSSKHNEETYAGYVQLDYAADSFFGYNVPIDGNIGIRIVHTDDTVDPGTLVGPFLSQSQCTPGAGGSGVSPPQSLSCHDWLNAVTFLGGGTSPSQIATAVANQGYQQALPQVTHGYTNFLPIFNFTAHLSDQVQTRLAYYETMVRPDWGVMYQGGTLSYTFYDANSNNYGTFKNSPSGYGGNPYLKPMTARNYDASVEWYFSPSGSLTLSLFHKDLANYIYSSTTTHTFTSPAGQTMTYNWSTFVNGSHGKVEGFELGYQQFYDSLPGIWGGFGVQANYTKIYNSGGHNNGGDVTSPVALANGADTSLPLEGMSNDSYNLALLYAKYNIDARVAWNWRSHYLSSSADANNKIPVWAENYGQLDGSVFYSFWDHFKIGVQATNLLREPIRTDMGFKSFHPETNVILTDRKFAIVLRTNW